MKIDEFELVSQMPDEEFLKLFGHDDKRKVLDLIEYKKFFEGTCFRCVEEVIPHLSKVTHAAFPLFKHGTSKIARKHVEEAIHTAVCAIICMSKTMLDDYDKGTEAAEAYPELEEWRQAYCQPPKLNLLTDNHELRAEFKDKAAWKRYKEEHNKAEREYFVQEQAEYASFYGAIQPLLCKYMPRLASLAGDYWVVFAAIFHISFDDWVQACDHIETTIAYGMPHESLEWEEEKWNALYQQKRQEEEEEGNEAAAA